MAEQENKKQDHQGRWSLFSNGNGPLTIQTIIQLGIVVGTVLGGHMWLSDQFDELRDMQEDAWRITDQVQWRERFKEQNPELEVPSAFDVWKRRRLDLDRRRDRLEDGSGVEPERQ